MHLRWEIETFYDVDEDFNRTLRTESSISEIILLIWELLNAEFRFPDSKNLICGMIWSIILQLVLFVTTAFLSTVLNIAVAVLPLRFKTLRTFSTCFLVHLSVVQVISSIVNVPAFILTRTLNLNFLRAKWSRWTTYTLGVALARMVPYSLVLIAGDRYCATNYGLRYHIWKTRKTTIFTICVTWVFSFVLTFSSLGVHGLKIEEIDLSTQSFYEMFLRSAGKYDLTFQMSVPILLILIFKILIWKAVRNSRKAIEKSLPTEATRKKLRKIQTKTLKTIAYTILLYLLCTLPRIFLFAVKSHGRWAEFGAIYSFFLFGVVNPILYAFRHRRFRKALSLLVRDPFGRTEPGVNPRLVGMQLVPMANKALRASAAANRVEVERDNSENFQRIEKNSESKKKGTEIENSPLSTGIEDTRL